MNTPRHIFTIFRAANREWCWRVAHQNGQQKARASETYKRKADCKRSLERMLQSIFRGSYWIKTEDGKA